MKVSYNWLKEYVEIKISPSVLADRLTMAGLEVVSLEKFAEDWILEIEVTTNRPDWLSIIGIAREVAVITGKKLKLPQIKRLPFTPLEVSKSSRREKLLTGFTVYRLPLPSLKIKIEDKKDCLRYIGRVVDNIEVRSSPNWLKKRLESVGLRPVNNVVDITNFCLLEGGQPLHAFDYDKIAGGTIIVRRAKDKERIITIVGETRELDRSILVIADKTKPVAIAGIMGGKGTEVSEKTKTVLLESAFFDPVTIRRGSQKLGLTTESSYRFERGVDLKTVFWASLRGVGLMKELASPKKTSVMIGRIEDIGLKKQKEKKVFLDTSRISRILGQTVSFLEIEKILKGLSFSLKKKSKRVLEVKVPSFRRDVEEDVDLIEEIARIYGYDKIPLTLSSLRQVPTIILELETRKSKKIIQETLLGLGLDEVISYSLIGRIFLEKINFPIDEKLIKISNPLSAEQEFLRPTLIASLLNIISHNIKRQMEDLKGFELGKLYLKEGNRPQEILCLGIAITGRRYFDWLRKIELVDFYELKGIIESIFRKINIPEFTMMPKEKPYFSPECSVEIKIKDKRVGFAGEVSNDILKNFDLTQKVYLAEIDLTKISFYLKQEKKLSPLLKYPFVIRDISFIVDISISYATLHEFFLQSAAVLIKEVGLVDVYTGDQIPLGKKSYTFSLKFQSPARTLRDEEIDEIETKIRRGLVERFGAQMR